MTPTLTIEGVPFKVRFIVVLDRYKVRFLMNDELKISAELDDIKNLAGNTVQAFRVRETDGEAQWTSMDAFFACNPKTRRKAKRLYKIT